MHRLFRLIVILLVASLALERSTALAHDATRKSPAPIRTDPQETSVILVNERALAGPNSAAQLRGGRLFLPIATIAKALGDTFSSDSVERTVTIRRQNGTLAVFNAPLNEVREHGAVVLTLSGTADLVFSPNPDELMLPAEIVAALLDVTIRRDQANAIIVSRKGIPAETIRTGDKHVPWELFQIEYDYNYNRYISSNEHNLVLRGMGRVGDARLSFIANSSMGVTHHSSRPTLQGGTVRLDRPNGQSFVGGEFGTGTEVEFLSAAVRGGLVHLPLAGVQLDVFGGQTTSGIFENAELASRSNADNFSPLTFRYDTPVFGAIVTNASQSQRQSNFILSGGGMHFGGSKRQGDILASGLKYTSGHNRVQADAAVGHFSENRAANQTTGNDVAINLAGSYNLTDQLLVQGRYAYVGPKFLGPQSGQHEPTNLFAANVSWQPRRWFNAALSGSTATKPGRVGQFNRYVSASFNLIPNNALPSLFVSHTQSGTTQLRSSAFTLVAAKKKFNHWIGFFNGSRVKTFGAAAYNAQFGANIRISDSNTLEVSQSVGSQGLLSGLATWQVSNLFRNRVSLSGGLGYTRSNSAPLYMSEHLTASVKLPRTTTLQFSYLHMQTGTTALVSLHGLFFSSKRAERVLNDPAADFNSYGSVYGRVYQDINLNGRFDLGIDHAQANVRVRVDGSRYVVSDIDGNFRIDSVAKGEHSVYLDLLSLRADLTLLDNTHQTITLDSRHDVVVDFRVVRTGRISGVVWFDANENGRMDEGEQPLPDVRVVTSSGRDTLTDDKGYFIIGDLPPGEHILFLDEKTLPDQTRSGAGSQTIKVTAANETTTIFPVTALPDQIKKFPKN